jgi:uncharacterized protein YxjI
MVTSAGRAFPMRLGEAGLQAGLQTLYSAHANRTLIMLLDHSTFFIKERVAFAKLTDTYDILDPATHGPIGIAKEEPPGWAKWLRLVIDKGLMPTRVNVYEADQATLLFAIKRGWVFLRAKVPVVDADGNQLGWFKSKLFSFGGGFYVFDNAGQQVAEVKGDWKGWNFKFLTAGGHEIGTVTKKWAGLGKELFTSADNYIIDIAPSAQGNPASATLLLAAGLAIDTILKEKNG